jgi:hypothetical protein
VDRERVHEIIKQTRFRDWRFETAYSAHETLVRAVFDAPDAFIKGEASTQWSRWWVVEEHDSDEQVIKTLLLCVLTAVEHEAREDFFYDNRRVFSPHKKP